MQILKDDGAFNLAMAPLITNGDKKLFGTLPVGNAELPDVKGMYLFLYHNKLVYKMYVFIYMHINLRLWEKRMLWA